MKIAVITLNYNGKKDTLDLLESLHKLPTTNYQLLTIVVDNGSTDGSVGAIKKQFPEVDILQTGQNLGFAGGFNRGIEYARIWGADYFLLINNDCIIKDVNLISELIQTAQKDSKIGLVSPKVYFAPGFEFHKDRYNKEDLGKVIWYAGGEFDWDNIATSHRGIDEVDKGQYDPPAGGEETGFISGACVLIKKEVIEKIGPFDENYFLYFEDNDFVKKVKDYGLKIYYNGNTSIYHKVSRSTGIGSPITDYYHTRNRLIFGIKYAKPRTKFALLRESLKLLLFGRPAQRKGVLDFFMGVKGKGIASHFTRGLIAQRCGNVEYPLKLSIGIVNYNTPDLTKKLLQSIFNKDSGFHHNDMEVIVLDNGLIDPCREKIKEFLPRIKYLKNKENEGFSKGYNKTIKFSLGKNYLMLNSDIEVLPNSLSKLLEAEENLGQGTVLGGKLEFPDGSDQDSVFHLPTLTGAFKEYFLAKKGMYFMYMPKNEGPVKVEGLVMACLLIPCKVIGKVGFLDEGTFIFFEDIEYCRRLKQFGIPIYFIPQARFIHHHGGSTKKIGVEKANEALIKASKHYHGRFYYDLLTFVLRLGQKFGRVQTPASRWTKND